MLKKAPRDLERDLGQGHGVSGCGGMVLNERRAELGGILGKKSSLRG